MRHGLVQTALVRAELTEIALGQCRPGEVAHLGGCLDGETDVVGGVVPLGREEGDRRDVPQRDGDLDVVAELLVQIEHPRHVVCLLHSSHPDQADAACVQGECKRLLVARQLGLLGGPLGALHRLGEASLPEAGVGLLREQQRP